MERGYPFFATTATAAPAANAVTVGLVAAGQHFRRADDTRFTAIEATDFHLLGRVLAGEDVGPVLRQRGEAGFNMLRVFTAYQVAGIGRLVPREHPGFYARIAEAARAIGRAGFYLEAVAFTGPYGGIFDTDDEKVAHWAHFVEAFRGIPCVLAEMVNEHDHPANKDLPFARLARPAGLFASHGSATMDTRPLEPFWDYATYHPASSEWQRKVGHNAMELWDGPTLTNETIRYPDNEQSAARAHDAAAGAALLCAGACFHSVNGKRSALWDATELAAAQSWAAGARSIALTCQDGGYRHRSDLEGAGVIRAYQRGQCVVRIHA